MRGCPSKRVWYRVGKTRGELGDFFRRLWRFHQFDELGDFLVKLGDFLAKLRDFLITFGQWSRPRHNASLRARQHSQLFIHHRMLLRIKTNEQHRAWT